MRGWQGMRVALRILINNQGRGGARGSVQKTVLDQAKTPDFSLPKLGFTQKSDRSRKGAAGGVTI